MDYNTNFNSLTTTSVMVNNTIDNTIPYAYLLGTLKASMNHATLGSIITYTLTLSNSGTTITTGLNLICTIPSATSLVTNSFSQDGIILNTIPNPPGLSLYNISAGKTSTITFQLLFTTIPSNNEISTSASLQYTYTNNTSLHPEIQIPITLSTNTIVTNFNYISAKIFKIVDRFYTKINSILTYTITIQFTGTATTNSLILIDTLPVGTSLVSGSLKQDGIILAGNPNPPGVTLLNRGLNTLTTISYKVIVESIPLSYKIQNSAMANINYIINPARLPITVGKDNIYTPIVTTTISKCKLIGVNTVDKPYASYGDILTYSITLINVGNTATASINFINTLPNGVHFVTNSLMQDGLLVAGTPTEPGLLLNNIAPGTSSTITFNVIITSTLPSMNPLINSSYFTYSYIVDPSTLPNTIDVQHTTTNIASTTINYAILDIKNIVDKSYSDIFTTLTYYIPISNIGNVTACSIILIDTIPDNSTYIYNSLKQDGVTIARSPLSSGIELNSIGPNITSTISFMILVQTLPTTDTIKNSATVSFSYSINPLSPQTTKSAYSSSNIATTTILRARLMSYIEVDAAYETIGKTLTYTIPITNTGNTPANHIRFISTIPYGTLFVANSLTENGIIIDESPEPPGVILSSIKPQATTTVSFKLTISTLPTSNSIKNSSTITYDYIHDPTSFSNIINTSSINTNITTTTISVATFDTVTLSTSISTITSNDIVTFTVTIPNTGNTIAFNVILYDTLPDRANFVPNSVTLNGVGCPDATPLPPTGFFIGTIPAGSTYVVKYKFQIS